MIRVVCYFTDWYADRQQQLAWVTQTCATKTVGRVRFCLTLCVYVNVWVICVGACMSVCVGECACVYVSACVCVCVCV